MNGIGRIGQPRRVPLAAKKIESALNLLISFGGGDGKLQMLLQDLKAAFEHNQKLLDNVVLAMRRLSDLEDQERQLDARQAEVDAKFLKLEKIQAEFERYKADLAAGKFDA